MEFRRSYSSVFRCGSLDVTLDIYKGRHVEETWIHISVKYRRRLSWEYYVIQNFLNIILFKYFLNTWLLMMRRYNNLRRIFEKRISVKKKKKRFKCCKVSTLNEQSRKIPKICILEYAYHEFDNLHIFRFF